MSLSREIFGETLTECAAELFKSGFLTDEILEKLYVHASRLCDEGQKFNLTAITDTREVALKHFADSLAAAYIINKIINEDNGKINNINIEDNEKINNISIKINNININEENTASKNAALSLLDVGSGAGFPALPIAAACPNDTAERQGFGSRLHREKMRFYKRHRKALQTRRRGLSRKGGSSRARGASRLIRFCDGARRGAPEYSCGAVLSVSESRRGVCGNEGPVGRRRGKGGGACRKEAFP